MRVKVKRVRGGSMGDQRDYGLVAGSIWNYEDKPTTNQVTDVLSPVPVDEATIEAEKNETIVYPNNDGEVTHAIVGGKRHSEGGTPLNIPDGAFVFSDTRSLKIKNKEMLGKIFGYNTSKSVTPAQIAKRYELNKYFDILKDPEADYLDKKTAQMMIDSNMTKLGQLALVQEGMKGFPDGIPDISMPLFTKNITSEQPVQQAPQMKFGGQFMRKGGKKLPRHQKTGPVDQQGFSYVDPATQRAYYVTPDGVATDIETGSAVSLSPDAYQSILNNLVQAQQQGQLAGTRRIPGERFGEATYMPEITGPEVNVRPDVTLPGGTQIPANMIYTPPITDPGMIYDADTKPWWDPAYQAYMNVATDPRTKAAGEALTAGALGTAALYGGYAAAPYAMSALNAVANVPLATTSTTAFTLGDLANAGFLVNTAMDAPDLYRSYRDVAEGKQTVDADLLGKTGETLLGISGGINLATKFGPGAISSLRSAYPALTSSWKAPRFARAENVTMGAGLPLMAAPSATNVAEGEGSGVDALTLGLTAAGIAAASPYIFGSKIAKMRYPEGKAFVEGMEMGKVKPAYKLKDGTIMNAEQFAYAQQNDPNQVIDAVQGIIPVKRGYSDFDEFVSLPDLFKMQGKRASLFVGRDAVPIQKSNPEYSQDALNKIDEAINTFKGFDESTPLSEVFARANPTERKKLIDAWNAYVPTEKARINLPQALIDDPSKINAESQAMIDDILGKWNVGEFPWMKSAYVRNNPEVLHGVQYQAGDYRTPMGAGLSALKSKVNMPSLPSWAFPKLQGNMWQKTKQLAGSPIGRGLLTGAGVYGGAQAYNYFTRPGESKPATEEELRQQGVVPTPGFIPDTTAGIVSEAPVDSAMLAEYNALLGDTAVGPVQTTPIVAEPQPTVQQPVNQQPRTSAPRSSGSIGKSDAEIEQMIRDKGWTEQADIDSLKSLIKQYPSVYIGSPTKKSGGSVIYVYDPAENTMTKTFADGGENGLPKHQTDGPVYDISDNPYVDYLKKLAESKNKDVEIYYPGYAQQFYGLGKDQTTKGVGEQTKTTKYAWNEEGTLAPIMYDDRGNKIGTQPVYPTAMGWTGVDSQIAELKKLGVNFGEYGTAGGDEAKGIALYKEDIAKGSGNIDTHQAANKWAYTKLREKQVAELVKQGFSQQEAEGLPLLVDPNDTNAWNFGQEIAGTMKGFTFKDRPQKIKCPCADKNGVILEVLDQKDCPPCDPAKKYKCVDGKAVESTDGTGFDTPEEALKNCQPVVKEPCKCLNKKTGKMEEVPALPNGACPPCSPSVYPPPRMSPFAMDYYYGAMAQQPYEGAPPILQQEPIPQVPYVLDDIARRVAGIKGAQSITEDSLQSVTADPSVMRAAQLQLSGQSSENIANEIARKNQIDLGIINNALAQNATFKAQADRQNLGYMKRYLDEKETQGQQEWNERKKLNQERLAAHMFAESQRDRVATENARNENFEWDPLTGAIVFKPGSFTGSGQKSIYDQYTQLQGLTQDQALTLELLKIQNQAKNQQNQAPGYPYNYNPYPF